MDNWRSWRTFVLVALGDAVLSSLVSFHLLTVLFLQPALGRLVVVIVFLCSLEVLGDARDGRSATFLGGVVAWRQVSQSGSRSEQLQQLWG
jgi:hypothetical protein